MLYSIPSSNLVVIAKLFLEIYFSKFSEKVLKFRELLRERVPPALRRGSAGFIRERGIRRGHLL